MKYNIIEIKNNVGDETFYEVQNEYSVLGIKIKTMSKTYFYKNVYDLKVNRSFKTILGALLWIKADMNENMLKYSRSVSMTISSMSDVDDAIRKEILKEANEKPF